MDISEELARVKNEEGSLIFDSFNANDAWALGKFITDKCREKNYDMAIAIELNNKKLFYYAFDGTDLNHERAIVRKINVTNAFRRSSLAMFYELKLKNNTISDRGRDPMDFLAVGGAIPIRIERTGIVGTACVSGLAHEQDHAFLAACMKDYIKDHKEDAI